MPTTSDIIKQLIAVVPTLTDKFSDRVIISSLSQVAGLVTATTSSPHGFENNDFGNVSGAIAPINVTNLVRNGNIVTGTTAEDHDLTLKFQLTLEIVGAVEPEYNGVHAILEVPNRRTFVYSITTTPSSPATGSILLFDGKERGYNGRFEITKISDTVFTYNINTDPVSPAKGNPVADGNIRISGGADIPRLQAAYSKQLANQSWLFVVRGAGFVTKNRQFDNDATATYAKGLAYRQQLIKPFDVYWFTPSINDIAGRVASDESEEIEKILIKALCGVPFDFIFDEVCDYLMSYTGERLFEYNTASYIHEYSFEISGYINQQDVVKPELNVAFRDIELGVQGKVADDLTEPLTVDIDLDDEP